MPHLGEVREHRRTGERYIWEFAGGERLRWARLAAFVAGAAWKTRHPDPADLAPMPASAQQAAVRQAARALRGQTRGRTPPAGNLSRSTGR